MHIPTITAPSVAIAGTTDRFPVRRIFCVGQNYADHAREMGSDPDRQEPFFFSKPADAVVANGSTLPFPPQTQDLHHEVELVIALGAGGKDIAVADAAATIFGAAVGIDLTRRDLQAAAKAIGRPWDMAKGFDRSAPIGAITPGAPAASGGIALDRRRDPPVGRPVDDDLERAGNHRDAIDLRRTGAGRPDLHRHPRGSRPDPPGAKRQRDDRRI